MVKILVSRYIEERIFVTEFLIISAVSSLNDATSRYLFDIVEVVVRNQFRTLRSIRGRH